MSNERSYEEIKELSEYLRLDSKRFDGSLKGDD